VLKKAYSAVTETRASIAYGPFHYPRSAVLGFVLGSIVYLLLAPPGGFTAGRTSDVGANVELLLACTSGAVTLLLLLSVGANYIIGKQVRLARALQDSLLGERPVPPMSSQFAICKDASGVV
jgi:hypothetical protein